MENSSNYFNIIEFKEDIMKKFHILESNLKLEYNSKFTKINSNLEEIELKINTLSHNNNSLLDLISKQNINLEKINKLENLGNKADQTLLTQEIQIKNIFEEISKIKNDIYKIVSENLIIPGTVGPGSVYKNLTEYLIYQMDEFNKLRNSIVQNKKKVDDWEKTAINIISNALFKFQTHYNNKHRQTHILIEKNKGILTSKILGLETNIEKYQNKINKLLKQMDSEFQDGIQSMSKEKNKNIEELNKKIEELNSKLDFIAQNLNNKRKISSSNSNNKENNISSHFKIDDENIIVGKKNILRLCNNSGSNEFYINHQNKGNKVINKELNKDDEKNNNSFIFKNNNNDASQIYSSSMNSTKRKNSSNQFINNEPQNNNKENNLPFLNEGKNKFFSKNKENNLINLQNVKNLKLIKGNNEDNLTNNFRTINTLTKLVSENKTREKNKGNIDKYTNMKNLTQNDEENINIKTKENNNIIIKAQNLLNDNSLTENKIEINNNTKQKSESKQTTNSIGKSPNLKINNSFFDDEEIYPMSSINVNSKESKSKENKAIQKNLTCQTGQENFGDDWELRKFASKEIYIGTGVGSACSSDEIPESAFFPENNGSKEAIFHPLENHRILRYGSELNLKNIKGNISINIKNKNDINSNILLSNNRDSNNKISIKKKKINFQMNTNIEQQNIISKIREYYNNKKFEIRKKSNKKVVECNLINLNLINSCENIHRRNNSYTFQRNTFYSPNNSKIKLESDYRNTNYNFFSKRDKCSCLKSFNCSINKEK